MRVRMEARGEGLCPVNTDCTTETLAGFLERAGYTDIRVVGVKEKVEHAPKSEARRVVRRPGSRQQTDHPATSGTGRPRRVVRRPRSESG